MKRFLLLLAVVVLIPADHAVAAKGKTEKHASRKTPIFLIVGTRDVLFPLPSVRATRDALAERGFPVELRELWNHNHNYYVRSGEINRYSWEFLSRQALPGEPKYKEYRR